MSLWDISIDRPVLALMATVALVIFGAISFKDLPVENMPNVDFPFLTITTIYPGADPETVESEVTEKIEDEVATVQGIKNLTSTSAENVSLVFMEFELDVDIDKVAQDVRDRMVRLQQQLPDSAKTPMVEKLDVMASSVLDVAVSGEVTPQDMEVYVEDFIKPKLEGIPGVGSVQVTGLRKREIRVWLDADRMAAHGVSPQQVVAAIQMNNVDIPGGRIETGEREFVVVTSGKLKRVEQFGDIIVASTNGSMVRLRDVARVESGLADLRSLSRLNGEPCVGLALIKQPGANEVRVADAAYKVIDELRAQIPPAIKITVPKDNSIFIRESFRQVRDHIIEGMFFAIITVLLFLGSFRTTLIAAVTIPTSIITTFIFMRAFNFSLNNVTMLAFSLMVGMLIDDAIVVLENIYRHVEQGKSTMKAARDGAREIAVAVLATTLSIVAVFIPVAFMSGIIGRFMYQYGITVAVGVSASYFVAVTLEPMLASQFLRSGRDNFFVFIWFNDVFRRVERGYRGLIAAALRRKWLTVGVAVLAAVAALGLFMTLPKEFESNVDMSESAVSIEMPVGTSLPALAAFTERIEAIVREMPEVENIYTTLGGGRLEEQNKGQIYIDLVDKRERTKNNLEFDSELRQRLAGIPGAKMIVGPPAHIGSNYAINLELTGNDMEQLRLVARRFADMMSRNEIFREVDTSWVEGKPQVSIELDRDRVADLGLDAASIGSTLRMLVSGEDTVGVFAEGGRQYDVKVRLESRYRDRPEDLPSLLVYAMNRGFTEAEVASFARVDVTSGPAEISHSGKMRSIYVYANINQGHTLGEASQAVNEMIRSYLPAGISARLVGMAEIMAESFESLGFTLVLAIVLIYLILAAQYNHFVHPLTIMTTLPVAFIGAFILLFLTRMTVNIFSLIGIIMLMGLVTKNAILVVEFTNQLRARGYERDEALLIAGPTRLRPVLMTTLSTIVGMLPVAIGLGGGAGTEFRAPMAVAVIGGLTTSTLLTLVLTPVVYALFDTATSRILSRTGIAKAYEALREPSPEMPDDQV